MSILLTCGQLLHSMPDFHFVLMLIVKILATANRQQSSINCHVFQNWLIFPPNNIRVEFRASLKTIGDLLDYPKIFQVQEFMTNVFWKKSFGKEHNVLIAMQETFRKFQMRPQVSNNIRRNSSLSLNLICTKWKDTCSMYHIHKKIDKLNWSAILQQVDSWQNS